MTDFTNIGNYGIDPWAGITQNQRNWYDPILRDQYLRRSVYSQNVTMQVDLGVPHARTIIFNDLIPPVPNIAVLADRETNATRLYQDSFQRQVTTER